MYIYYFCEHDWMKFSLKTGHMISVSSAGIFSLKRIHSPWLQPYQCSLRIVQALQALQVIETV